MDTIIGLDDLLGIKYQQAILASHPTGKAVGVFHRTVDNALPLVKAVAAARRTPLIRDHLAPFDRSHQYPIAALLPQMLADAKSLEVIQKMNPSICIVISPFCEHKHKARDMIPVFEHLRSVAPSCKFVNSVLRGGERVPGIPQEYHIENMSSIPSIQSGDAISFDGFGGKGEGDFSDCDIQSILKKYLGTAWYILGWDFEMNGKFGHDDVTPLHERDNFPSKEYLQGKFSTLCLREGPITYDRKKALYKAFADDHDGPNAKDNKAMLIFKSPANSIDVFDSRGKKIDTMTRVNPVFRAPGDPLHGATRFYSSKYAFQIASSAKKNTGSYLIRIGNLPLTDGRLRSTYR